MTARNSGKFRFWHDERRFKGGIDKCLVQEALFAAGARSGWNRVLWGQHAKMPAHPPSGK